MNIPRLILICVVLVVIFGGYYFLGSKKTGKLANGIVNQSNLPGDEGGLQSQPHALSIESLRKGEYPGSEITIEQTLSPGSNYQRYIASYKSEGLKIYALLTIPDRDPSASPQDDNKKYPVIVFNHGYIPPKEYSTTEKYVAYTDAFSRAGYIVFKPDFRGHGNSEGQASGGYGSNGYTIDVLNAVASIKKYPGVNTNRIGMWGHSMGGYITLRNMVVSKDIKAGVIWAGVVGSYPDLINRWRRTNFSPPPQLSQGARRWRQQLTEEYGTPEQNPDFWNKLSANSYLQDTSGPIQLHHGTADSSVPLEFSQKLNDQLKAEGKEVEIYTYEGDDHNLANNLGLALQRSVEFFNKHLKNTSQ